ncbi:MAG: phosphoglycerate kinase [Candidatus Parcubacteria bacterium]|nr:phosphoglycerate kinase [Candidatus Parcubacteria bacterium]
MNIRTIAQIKNLKNKAVLVRVDYNVALKKGKIMETERIDRSLKTISYLLKKKAKVILISHLGNPGGKVLNEFSLKPVAHYLDSKSHKPVIFIEDCLGTKAQDAVRKLKSGQILMLENLRFHEGEEKNDPKFARNLSDLADIYVNEAFSVCHRAHASISAITKYLPAYAGFNLANEVINLNKLLKGFKRPAVAIIGGVKISTKIKVIENLLRRYDYVLVGGALANNFFVAKKLNIGKSIFEKEYVKLANSLLLKSKGKLILPLDVRVAKKINKTSEIIKFNIADLVKVNMKNYQIVDIGPKTENYFESFIHQSKTIVWNGPMGVFEIESFSHGTNFICQKVSAHAKGPAFGVVGGGETIAALDKLKIKSWPDFVSTAGGAMLEFLEGKILPGIKPLLK